VKPRAKWLWLALAVFIPLGVAWSTYPLPDASPRLSQLFPHGSPVSSRDIPLEDGEETVFAGATVLKRLATVQNQIVVVTVIDGTRNRHAVHDPLFCFRGAGWEIGGEEMIPLGTGAARLLHLRKGEDRADALCWFSTGNRQFTSPLLHWWKTSLRRLTFGKSGPEPVLTILSSTSEGLPDWPALIRAWPGLQDL